MAIRGERFYLDLDEKDNSVPRTPHAADASLPLPFVKDIEEKDNDASFIPPPPQLAGPSTGFPEHKKRSIRSKFKAERQQPAPKLESNEISATDAFSQHSKNGGLASQGVERESVQRESEQMLANMSVEEKEKEQKELLSGLPPSLIERLLKRANIDDDSGSYEPHNIAADPTDEPLTTGKRKGPTKELKTVSFASLQESKPEAAQDRSAASLQRPAFDPEGPGLEEPPGLVPATYKGPLPRTKLPDGPSYAASDHPGTLDPSSDTFLEDLHSTYFPNLPADPSALSWMKASPTDFPYDPSLTSVPASELRFDFMGRLIPPSIAEKLPQDRGLHHHGRTPTAAGYTINELGMLARSAVPAQRAVAYQTLGRILYRLGKGMFGAPGNEAEDLYEGLWRELGNEKVLEVLVREAGRDAGSGHETARVKAVEATWLWRKGGGKWVGTT